jgi:anti-sigma B factor antagonist
MKYTIDKQGGFAVLTLEEENLNSSLAPQFKSDLFVLSNEGINNLILDLSKVKYVDSSGLSAILTGQRLWKTTGMFVLAGELQPMVRKLIEISRLDSIIMMSANVHDAIELVGSTREEA